MLDVPGESRWREWSAQKLTELAESALLVINPIIYAEVSVRFAAVEDRDEGLPTSLVRREAYSAGFLVGKCYLKYQERGGVRRSVMPDFYIGAHAAVCGYHLLTRDVCRYKSYFPTASLISPEPGEV